MASSLYRGYLIVGSADYDQTTHEWRPIALVFPADNGSRIHTIKNLPKTFQNQNDAELYAVDAGRAWVDAQLDKTP